MEDLYKYEKECYQKYDNILGVSKKLHFNRWGR